MCNAGHVVVHGWSLSGGFGCAALLLFLFVLLGLLPSAGGMAPIPPTAAPFIVWRPEGAAAASPLAAGDGSASRVHSPQTASRALDGDSDAQAAQRQQTVQRRSCKRPQLKGIDRSRDIAAYCTNAPSGALRPSRSRSIAEGGTRPPLTRRTDWLSR